MSIVSMLRDRIVYSERTGYDRVNVSKGDLATLLDIVEAVAAMEPYEPAIGERYELECLFCSELGDRREDGEAVVTHDPDCAKAKADALCGKEDAS